MGGGGGGYGCGYSGSHLRRAWTRTSGRSKPKFMNKLNGQMSRLGAASSAAISAALDAALGGPDGFNARSCSLIPPERTLKLQRILQAHARGEGCERPIGRPRVAILKYRAEKAVAQVLFDRESRRRRGTPVVVWRWSKVLAQRRARTRPSPSPEPQPRPTDLAQPPPTSTCTVRIRTPCLSPVPLFAICPPLGSAVFGPLKRAQTANQMSQVAMKPARSGPGMRSETRSDRGD